MPKTKPSEIDFSYTPLCDAHVVTWLIDNRQTVWGCM